MHWRADGGALDGAFALRREKGRRIQPNGTEGAGEARCSNDGAGDIWSGQQRTAKVRFTRIAIIPAVAPDARDQPSAVRCRHLDALSIRLKKSTAAPTDAAAASPTCL
jgi:hypothetical protein